MAAGDNTTPIVEVSEGRVSMPVDVWIRYTNKACKNFQELQTYRVKDQLGDWTRYS